MILNKTKSLTTLTNVGWKRAEKITLYYRKEYGNHLNEEDIYDSIKDNPYELCKVKGIGFKTADEIALFDFNFDPDTPTRHYYGNKSILDYGGGVMAIRDFKNKRDELRLKNPELEKEGVIFEAGLAWHEEEIKAEFILSQFARNALKEDVIVLQDEHVDKRLENMGLNSDQKRAVHTALAQPNVMCLTGDAGTGKSFTIAAIAKEALRKGKKVAAMAFAGKAADRVKEALAEYKVQGAVSGTIHKTLGLYQGITLDTIKPVKLSYDEDSHEHIETETLDADIIILDEASMIHNWLLACVINAKKPSASLILVGDPAQLPPVGWGTPFSDLLALGATHCHLEQNYRQKDEQDIYLLGKAIRNSRKYTPESEAAQLFYDNADWNAVKTSVINAKHLSLNSWQVITWTNRTREEFNLKIQNIVNPDNEAVFTVPCWNYKPNNQKISLEVRVGDKIMITDNDYQYSVMNGQTGVVTNVSHDEDNNICVDLDIDGHYRQIPVAIAENLLTLGYCITVHKAQGSGWDYVIFAQPFAVSLRAKPKRLYYTAITRAKTKLDLYSGMSESDFWANASQEEFERESYLSKRIRGVL